LSQALDALASASSAPVLYSDPEDYYIGSMLEPIQRRLSAQHRRLGFLRSTVLFAALSAEAYANEFLEATQSRADADALDRLAPPEKLLIGSRLVDDAPALERGKAPMQDLVRLFEVRNALVHPRRSGCRSVAAYAHNVEDRDTQLVGPTAAVCYLVAVAQVTVLLEPCRPGLSKIGEANRIAEHRTVLDEHVRILGDDIMSVPEPADPAPVPLLVQMQRRAAKRAKRTPAGKPAASRKRRPTGP
jgi:hypothetical protein